MSDADAAGMYVWESIRSELYRCRSLGYIIPLGTKWIATRLTIWEMRLRSLQHEEILGNEKAKHAVW